MNYTSSHLARKRIQEQNNQYYKNYADYYDNGINVIKELRIALREHIKNYYPEEYQELLEKERKEKEEQEKRDRRNRKIDKFLITLGITTIIYAVLFAVYMIFFFE